MFETIRYELSRKRRGTTIFIVAIGVIGLFYISLFPSLQAANIDIDAMIEAWPPALREAFGVETIASIEGFLAVELYNVVWLLLLGLYFAYSAAGLIAADIERDRMDLLLSFPVSRSRLLLEKFVALLIPIVALNAVVALLVYGGVRAIGESIDPVSLVMVHFLSLPYLFVCAAIGLVLSVVVDRADIAQRIAIGSVFILYLIESLDASTEGFEWIGYVSPTHYYNPTPILVHETYDWVDAGILLAGFVALVIVAQVLFRQRDI